MNLKNKIQKLSWWKRIVLLAILVTIVMVTIVIWKIVNEKPYYIKDGLCYSDFLENCEGKKVEVTGKIIKDDFCMGRGETYILCNTSIPPCSSLYKEASLIESISSYLKSLEISQVSCHYPLSFPWVYDDCLRLVKVCDGEGVNKEINDYVENLLPNPANKSVKVKGRIFIYKAPRYAKTQPGNIGIIPESITVIEDEISVTPKNMMVIEDEE